MTDQQKNIHKEITEQGNKFIDIMKNSQSKDDLNTCRVAFRNLFNNFEREYEIRLDQMDREEAKELETLRKIKELLDK